MKIVHSANLVKALQLTQVGFVPTMGALHEGHLALVKEAKKECPQVVVSIFVNPTQFNDPNDLKHYPRNLESDCQLLKEAGVDVVFAPDPTEIYNDDFRYRVSESQISQILCGPFRPGHFEGVLTVVLKLLQIVNPKKAYFGEKDYQQLVLIKEMAKAFFLPCEIIGCPTIREADGLALSSRNLRLSPQERENAALMFKALTHSKNIDETKQALSTAGFKVDYVEEHWGRRFAAAYLGNVRLIDNVELT